MRSYELTFLVKGDIAEAAKKKVVEQVKSFVKELKLKEEKEHGKKVLSYDIKKQKDAVFFTLYLEGENLPEGLDTKLKGEEQILRHLLIRTK